MRNIPNREKFWHLVSYECDRQLTNKMRIVHQLKHINFQLLITFSDFPKGLVLVAPLLNILLVDLVHRRLRLVTTKSKVKITKVYASTDKN